VVDSEIQRSQGTLWPETEGLAVAVVETVAVAGHNQFVGDFDREVGSPVGLAAAVPSSCCTLGERTKTRDVSQGRGGRRGDLDLETKSIQGGEKLAYVRSPGHVPWLGNWNLDLGSWQNKALSSSKSNQIDLEYTNNNQLQDKDCVYRAGKLTEHYLLHEDQLFMTSPSQPPMNK
jgi:hypothetical protein